MRWILFAVLAVIVGLYRAIYFIIDRKFEIQYPTLIRYCIRYHRLSKTAKVAFGQHLRQ
jgi:hypothetical protein